MNLELLELLSTRRWIVNSKFILESALHTGLTDWELVLYNDAGGRVVYKNFQLDWVDKITVDMTHQTAFITFK